MIVKIDILKRKRARRFALQALYQWQFNPDKIENILEQFLDQDEMQSVDVAFFSTLFSNIVKMHEILDKIFMPLTAYSSTMIEPVEKSIVRIGVYELLHCVETPYRIVIDEAIELSKRFGTSGSHRYVNGILHAVAKQIRSSEVQCALVSKKTDR